ncbi:MAG: carbamoyl-phosphate synthase small subunit [Proteobacteria bacterium]|nr:carbamoyl-phosphate synthase small subunit [Pseudomonadota bacterium]
MADASPKAPTHANACLLLADGKLFYGIGVGAPGIGVGEICFNTAMTGYQEVLTDPSFAGQIITFTFPHIGNVGCNDEDIEAERPYATGLVIREPITRPSSFRATEGLDEWLKKYRISGISGVDTRALTRHIRAHGSQNAAICVLAPGESFDMEKMKAAIAACPPMKGRELAGTVSTSKPYSWSQTGWKLGSGYGTLEHPRRHVVAIDYGEKLNILRSLAERGCAVTVVPATASAEEILALKPDGVFLSNGPGDPSATGEYAVPTLQKLVHSGVPVFGICLGHQLLGLALGGKTYKLPQGHRGANQPVKNLETGAVEITSQNHGFAVDEKSLPANVKVTHVSLFDGVVEGLRAIDKPVFSVQYHPESSPGPHDSQYLFDNFLRMMEKRDVA